MILNYITWNVSPDIFHIPDDVWLIGGFTVRWYGLLFAMAFVVGYIIMLKIFKNEGLSTKMLDELSTYMIVFTIIGARLGHCFFYEPKYFLAHPLEILMIWKGGLASHGAAIGILVGLYFFSKKNHKPFIWIMDRIGIVVALGGAFIRIGNLMNSEIFGDVTSLPWGFKFVNYYIKEYTFDPRHPTQIYEALSYLALFFFLYWYYWKHKGHPRPGTLFGYFLIVLFTARFLIEFIKVPQVGFEQNMTLDMGQWLSIPFILAGIALLIWSARKYKKPAD